MTRRDEAKQETRAAILKAARHELATQGAGGLSMRAIAREVGLVSSAVFRYFPTKDALLTTMIVDSYTGLARHLVASASDPEAVGTEQDPAGRWRALAVALRDWALEHPHEFQLIYGTPVPGYQAPPETTPAAAQVAAPFLAVGAVREVAAFASVTPSQALQQVGVGSGVAAVIAELACLVGLISLELSGHFVGVVPPDGLFAAAVERQVSSLGLPSAG